MDIWIRTFTRYFPEGAKAYDPYLFVFETDYEDFIVDLFSELPTSTFFFKVSDKLLMSGRMIKTSVRKVDLEMPDISHAICMEPMATYGQNAQLISYHPSGLIHLATQNLRSRIFI